MPEAELTDAEILMVLSNATIANGVIELQHSRELDEFAIEWGWGDDQRVRGDSLREAVQAFEDMPDETGEDEQDGIHQV